MVPEKAGQHRRGRYAACESGDDRQKEQRMKKPPEIIPGTKAKIAAQAEDVHSACAEEGAPQRDIPEAVSWGGRLAAGFVWLYGKLISPLYAPTCRYSPTCSSYAREAFYRHGFFKGCYLSTARILRCHPWAGPHWHDPVPKRFAWRDILGYKRKQSEKSGTEHSAPPDQSAE